MSFPLWPRSLATILVFATTGCIPSPNAPMGAGQATTPADSEVKPERAPVVQPPVAGSTAGFASMGAADQGGNAPLAVTDSRAAGLSTAAGDVRQTAATPIPTALDTGVVAPPLPSEKASRGDVPVGRSTVSPVSPIPDLSVTSDVAALPDRSVESPGGPFVNSREQKTVPSQVDPVVEDRQSAGDEQPRARTADSFPGFAQVQGESAERRGSPLPLIPLASFFESPRVTQVKISPDGKSIAYLALDENIQQLWVAAVDDFANPHKIEREGPHDVTSYSWSFTGRQILFLEDVTGTGNYHVFSTNLDTRETRDLTPLRKCTARVLAVSEKFPSEILVGINERQSRSTFDVHRINIVTGAHKVVHENEQFDNFYVDDDYELRLAEVSLPMGGRQILQPGHNAEDGGDRFLTIEPRDAATTILLGFDKSAQNIYLLGSLGRDKGALVLMSLETGQQQVVSENESAEISGVLLHPTEKHIQAVTIRDERQKWTVLDDRIDADLEYLHSAAFGEIEITSRTLNDMQWVVGYHSDQGPVEYYLYERDPKSLIPLLKSHDQLGDLPLVPMASHKIPTPDGWKLVSYLSLPAGSDTDEDGRPDQPLPLVLVVHGGPWARDVWGYNPLHQMLANRGYAVLSVNYRGSAGLGKSFLDAGNREWTGKVHDDLITAVGWAVENGIADQSRVGILGGSFGGYLSLVGLSRSPELFRCGVNIVGPSNLLNWLKDPPADWQTMQPLLKLRVGDHQSEEGRQAVLRDSPWTLAERIVSPILMAQGELDPSVPGEETEQLVKRLRAKGVAVTYLVYPDEGHGFRRAENRLNFYRALEQFLAEQLN